MNSINKKTKNIKKVDKNKYTLMNKFIFLYDFYFDILYFWNKLREMFLVRR